MYACPRLRWDPTSEHAPCENLIMKPDTTPLMHRTQHMPRAVQVHVGIVASVRSIIVGVTAAVLLDDGGMGES